MVVQPDLQSLDNGSTAGLPHLPAVLGGMAADRRLDGIEFADPRQHLARQRRLGGDEKFIERAPHVGPAERQRHRAIGAIAGQPLEPGIAVNLQHAAEPGQVASRSGALAVLRIVIRHHRMPRPVPRTVIDGVAPQASGLGAPAAGIEHRQGGVVGEQLGGGQHRAGHQLGERGQPPAGPSHPVRQRRAVQRDALALQHLRLPIQRQGVGELADDDVRDQRLGRQAAIERTLRRGRHQHDILAAAAGIARPPGDPHAQLRRHDVELLAAQLTDRPQLAAAARAIATADVDHHLVARQMRRQGAMVAAAGAARRAWQAGRRGRRILGRLLARFLGRDALLDLLETELQLVGAQLFGATAELVAQQTLDQQA